MGRPATCHPDRPHKAKGQCAKCYDNAKTARRRTEGKPLSRNQILRNNTPKIMSSFSKRKEGKN